MISADGVVDVLLPAGGRIEGQFARSAGTPIKALISFGGETILERTLRILRETGRVRHLVVIGPEEVREPARAADAWLPESTSGPANIMKGLEWLRQHAPAPHALILATDLPLLTPEALSGFLGACPSESDVCVPVFRRQEYHARFPGGPAEFVRLRDGEWTIGGAFLLNRDALARNERNVQRAFDARKSQLRMLTLLGPVFVARFLMRQLAVRHLEERCARILGCSGRAIMGCDASLAFDIDLPEELEYARRQVEAIVR